MIRYLKTGVSAEAAADTDSQVRRTVERLLAGVGARGDAAVRELSEKFDKWSPASFRLSPDEIDRIVSSIPRSVIEDIKFAQTQIRRFAELQRAALVDIEVETIPGVKLGHRNIPIDMVAAMSQAAAIQ